MPSAAELGDAFYSGSLFGQDPNSLRAGLGSAASARNQANPGAISNRKGATGSVSFTGGFDPNPIFGQDAYEAAIKGGYSSKDINRFLQESGVKASGSMFQVGGMGSYQGKSDVYWQVTPGYKPPTAAASPSPIAAPDYGNKVETAITLPNNGLATIESIQAPPPTVSAPAPVLGDPLGEGSQRVSRQKARLSIAS